MIRPNVRRRPATPRTDWLMILASNALALSLLGALALPPEPDWTDTGVGCADDCLDQLKAEEIRPADDREPIREEQEGTR